MFKNCGFEAENVRQSVITGFLKRFTIKALAEEDPAGGEGDENKPSVNLEQMLAQVRKEEKEKLYPRLKKAEDDLKVMTTNNNNNLLIIAGLKDELDKAQKQGDESQVIKDLKKQIDDLTVENKKLKDSTPNEKTLREQIEAEYKAKYELDTYIAEQKAAKKDEILPTFLKNIKGSTKEEIDKAIEDAVSDTLETKKSLGLVDEKGNPIDTKKKDVKKDKPPLANPSGAKDEEFDADYVRNLKPGTKEYAEWRQKMGLK